VSEQERGVKQPPERGDSPAPVEQGADPTAATGRLPSLWRNHDFMILWTGETVSQLGSSMSFFIFPIIGYSLTGSTTKAALALTAYTFGNVVLRLQAGALIDRWNRKRVLIAANGSGAILYGTLVAAGAMGRLTLAHLIVVALLTGVAGSFFGPAEQAAIRAVVPARQLPTAFSQNQARQHVALLVGPPVAGVLYAIGRSIPFLVDTVTYAISAASISRIRAPLSAPERVSGGPTKMRHEITEGLRFLMSRGFFRATVIFATVVNFGADALFLVLTLKLLRAGVQPAAIGTIDAIGAIAGLTGAMLAPGLIRRVPTGMVAIGTSLLIVVGCIPMAFTNNVVLIGLLLAVALLGNPAGNAAITSYLVAVTPDRLQGRVSSALGFTATAFRPLSPLLGGFLLAVLGGQAAILITAVIMSVSVVALLASAEVRRLPTPDKWDLSSAVEPMPSG
jgi:MFS family permease